MNAEDILHEAHKKGLSKKVFKKATKIKDKNPYLSINEVYYRAYSKVKKKYSKKKK